MWHRAKGSFHYQLFFKTMLLNHIWVDIFTKMIFLQAPINFWCPAVPVSPSEELQEQTFLINLSQGWLLHKPGKPRKVGKEGKPRNIGKPGKSRKVGKPGKHCKAEYQYSRSRTAKEVILVLVNLFLNMSRLFLQ